MPKNRRGFRKKVLKTTKPVVPLISDSHSGSSSDSEVVSQSVPELIFRMTSSPDPFYGKASEDANSWIRQIDWWIVAQRPTSERVKIALVAGLLKDAALHWFNSLSFADPGSTSDLTVITTYDQFRDRFSNRFAMPEDFKWRAVSALFNIKQSPQQTTEAFVNEIRTQGFRAQASDAEMRYAALAGLQEAVRAHVLHHNIESLDDIVRWGAIADSTTTTAVSLSREVAELKQLLERVPQSIAPPASHMFAAVHQAGQDRRGFIQDARSTEGQFNQQSDYRYSRGGGKRGNRPARGRYDQNNQRYEQSQRRGKYNYYNSNISNNNYVPYCNSCGLNHDPRAGCPAFNAICRRCSGLHHFARCCTQQPPMQASY